MEGFGPHVTNCRRMTSVLARSEQAGSPKGLEPMWLASNSLGQSASIYQADAWDVFASLPSDSVDLVITSPPYWGLRTYGLDHDADLLERWRQVTHDPSDPPGYQWYRENGGQLGLEPYPEWFVAHLAEILNCAARVLKPSGSLWINLGDTYFARWSSIRPDGRQGLGRSPRKRRRTPAGGIRHDKQLLLIPARFAIAMQEQRWILRNDVIWAKPGVAPRPEQDRLRLSHEHLFHFVKRAKNGRPAYFYELSHVEDGARDVVSVATSNGGGGHSATFPNDLVTPRIASSSPPDGVVLDCFCGSGTALLSAWKLGRNVIGSDLSAEYAELATERLQDIPGITA
jgi:site-specific DNA-methyltransferase (cytosine-N4-specific)